MRKCIFQRYINFRLGDDISMNILKTWRNLCTQYEFPLPHLLIEENWMKDSVPTLSAILVIWQFFV